MFLWPRDNQHRNLVSHTHLRVWMFEYGSLFTLCSWQFSLWFTYCLLLKDFPLWPTFPDLDIFHPVYLNSYTSVFSSHSLWLSFLGLRFCAFSSHGSGYIGQLSLLPVVHEQVNMLNFSWQFDGFENCHPQDITVVTATCHDVKVSYDMHQLYYTYNNYQSVLIQSASK